MSIIFCSVLKSLSIFYERGLTIKQYEFSFTGPTADVGVAIIAFVKVLELLSIVSMRCVSAGNLA